MKIWLLPLVFVFLSALGSDIPISALTKTTVVIYSPWQFNALRRGFVVSVKASGSCWTNSLASGREDSWRCMYATHLYDPCFRSADATEVACEDGPFSNRVVVIKPRERLDRTALGSESWSPSPPEAPFDVRLSNGDTCAFATGVSDEIDGLRLNYVCARSGSILGVPDRSKAIWTVRIVQSLKDRRVRQAAVATAVF